MRALGLSPDDYGDEDAVEIWPENLAAVNFFIDCCSTQWRTGMGGATGLDYTAVIATLQLEGLDKAVFEQVRCIERGALFAMAEKRRRDEAER